MLSRTDGAGGSASPRPRAMPAAPPRHACRCGEATRSAPRARGGRRRAAPGRRRRPGPALAPSRSPRGRPGPGPGRDRDALPGSDARRPEIGTPVDAYPGEDWMARVGNAGDRLYRCRRREVPRPGRRQVRGRRPRPGGRAGCEERGLGARLRPPQGGAAEGIQGWPLKSETSTSRRCWPCWWRFVGGSGWRSSPWRLARSGSTRLSSVAT
jgi:hypothetical protein